MTGIEACRNLVLKILKGQINFSDVEKEIDCISKVYGDDNTFNHYPLKDPIFKKPKSEWDESMLEKLKVLCASGAGSKDFYKFMAKVSDEVYRKKKRNQYLKNIGIGAGIGAGVVGKKIYDKKKAEKRNQEDVKEYVDILINAKRYEIITEDSNDIIYNIKTQLSNIINNLKRDSKCQSEFKKYNAKLIYKEIDRSDNFISFKIINGDKNSYFYLRDWLRIIATELKKQLHVDVDWGKFLDEPDGIIEIEF